MKISDYEILKSTAEQMPYDFMISVVMLCIGSVILVLMRKSNRTLTSYFIAVACLILIMSPSFLLNDYLSKGSGLMLFYSLMVYFMVLNISIGFISRKTNQNIDL